MSGGGGGEQVVGYWYRMDVLLVFCHGPVDEIVAIHGGDREAWTGTVTSNTTIQIQKRGLFGGEEREGGMDGYVDLAFGASDQTVNPAITTALNREDISGPTPAYRGLTSMFFRGINVGALVGFVWSAMNPYFKGVAAKLRRYPKWYPAKARIGDDANPVHIIYECLTNPSWGLGFPVNDIDDTRFKAAADVLYSESFGISLSWNQSSTIENFVGMILQHFAGVLNQDRTTGQLFITLIRDDYDSETLPILDPSNCTVESLARAGNGEIVNEVTLKYTRVADGETDSLTIQDLASINNQGRIIAQEIDLPGLRDPDLASRVALRELQSRSRGLAKITITATRAAYGLYVGDVFVLDWPKLGISGLVCRVASVDIGDLEAATIRIEAVEDVFGLPSYSYVVSPPVGWVDNSGQVEPVIAQRVVEAPYYIVIKKTNSSDRLDYPDDFGFGLVMAPAPKFSNPNFLLQTSPDGVTYSDAGNGLWSSYATLLISIGREQDTIQIANLKGDLYATDLLDGDLLFVGDEIMEYTGVTSYTPYTIGVIRGVLDTIPANHVADTEIHVWKPRASAYDPTVRVDGETAYYKVLTKSTSTTLDPSLATPMSLTFDGRFQRPYPPGNVRINGQYWPSTVGINQNIPVTWVHRDRVQQTVQPLVGWFGAGVGPEAGVTYTLRVYNGSGGLLDTQAGLTGTSATIFPSAATSGNYRVELEAVRSTLVSRLYSHTFTIS